MPDASPESTSPIPGALLLGLDLQAPFLDAIADSAAVIRRCALAFAAARGLGLPAAFTEQVPQKLGSTVAAVREVADATAPVFAKSAFSALVDPAIEAHCEELGVEHLILCGIETPICVYQTALDALGRNMAVTVLSDAVGARRPADAAVVLAALERHGVHVLPLETVFYALLHDATHPFFKRFTTLVKSHG